MNALQRVAHKKAKNALWSSARNAWYAPAGFDKSYNFDSELQRLWPTPVRETPDRPAMDDELGLTE